MKAVVVEIPNKYLQLLFVYCLNERFRVLLTVFLRNSSVRYVETFLTNNRTLFTILAPQKIKVLGLRNVFFQNILLKINITGTEKMRNF